MMTENFPKPLKMLYQIPVRGNGLKAEVKTIDQSMI